MQRAGTLIFLAPEMFSAEVYDERADVWAIGCILFLLVAGVHPFWNRRMSVEEIKRRIAEGRAQQAPAWVQAPENVRDLASRLLTVAPEQRPRAAEALRHRWFQVLERPAEPIPAAVFAGLRAYHASSKLRKAVLKLLAKELDEQRVKRLREQFRQLDVGQDGCLSRQELAEAMRTHLGLEHLCDADVMRVLPPHCGDRVGFTDFLAAMLAGTGFSRAELLNAFRRFDVRREGRISLESLGEVLRNAGPESRLEAFREADVGRDGYIDFEEFCALVGSVGS